MILFLFEHELHELTRIMFGMKKVANSDYFTGLGEGKATAYTLISEVIEAHADEDPKAVLIAIKTICDYELLGNPYRSHVHLMKTKAKEL